MVSMAIAIFMLHAIEEEVIGAQLKYDVWMVYVGICSVRELL